MSSFDKTIVIAATPHMGRTYYKQLHDSYNNTGELLEGKEYTVFDIQMNDYYWLYDSEGDKIRGDDNRFMKDPNYPNNMREAVWSLIEISQQKKIPSIIMVGFNKDVIEYLLKRNVPVFLVRPERYHKISYLKRITSEHRLKTAKEDFEFWQETFSGYVKKYSSAINFMSSGDKYLSDIMYCIITHNRMSASKKWNYVIFKDEEIKNDET